MVPLRPRASAGPPTPTSTEHLQPRCMSDGLMGRSPAPPGYLLGKAGVPKYAIITALAGTPTPDLASFVEALKVRWGGVGWQSVCLGCCGLVFEHGAAVGRCLDGSVRRRMPTAACRRKRIHAA